MADWLADGRQIRLLNVLDDFNLDGQSVEVDFALPTERVVRSLNPSSGKRPPSRFLILLHIGWRGRPLTIIIILTQQLHNLKLTAAAPHLRNHLPPRARGTSTTCALPLWMK